MINTIKNISNTNFKKSLINSLNIQEWYLFWHIESEYSWIFGDIFAPLKKIDKDFEDKFTLFKDNSRTNKSPDFIFWNMKIGLKIGIEITSPFIPSRVFYKKEKNEKEIIKDIKRNIEIRNEKFNIFDKFLKIINNKIKKISNWEFVNIKIIIINIPYNKIDNNWKNNIIKNDAIFLEKIFIEIKKNNEYIITLISHTENNLNNWKNYIDINYLYKNILN